MQRVGFANRQLPPAGQARYFARAQACPTRPVLVGDVFGIPAVPPTAYKRCSATEAETIHGAVQLPASANVSDVRDMLRMVTEPHGQSPLDRVYLYEGEHYALVGHVLLHDILKAEPVSLLDVMRRDGVTLHRDTPLNDAIDTLFHTGESLAAVVDDTARFKGVFTTRDAARIRDLCIDEVPVYFATPVETVVRGRAPWLISLLMLQSVSSMILGHFSSLIERNVVLALFLTMLTGTSGNAGTQSATMLIRGLATGEIDARRDFWKVLAKELRVASVLGVLLSAVALARVVWMTDTNNSMSALAVALAMLLTVVAAAVLATVTPIALERLSIDPALGAGPALSTLTDIAGVLLLCLVASALLGQ